MNSDHPTPRLRAKDHAPVDSSLKQRDTLKSVKRFLEDTLGDGAANTDPLRLYAGVCDALNEPPKPDLVQL